MDDSPAQELDLGGLDPWAEAEDEELHGSSSAAPAPGSSSDHAKSTADGLDEPSRSSPTAIKAPIPRPFKTAPLTAPRTLSKGLGRAERAATTPLTPISPSGTTPIHPSPLHSTSIATPIASSSSAPPRATRSQSHPLALDELANDASTLSLDDDDDYTYGAYGRTTGAAVSSSSLQSRHRTPLNRSRSGSAASPYKELDIRDVTRPALNRMTSETERQLSVGSWSAASSENGNGNGQYEEEKEYIVHAITPNDSLPGISLRYGIDLPALRKANRLWPSDPIYLRTEVYIPLDACHPTAAGDHIERDSEGGARLVRRRPSADDEDILNGVASSSASTSTVSPADEVLTVVRMPKSKMRFFPASTSSKPRKSLEMDISRSADSVRQLTGSERAKKIVRHRPADGLLPGSSSDPNSTNHLAPPSPTKSSSKTNKGSSRNVVRLRPPTAAPPPPAHATLADRLSQLFTVPPPPAHLQPPIPMPREAPQVTVMPTVPRPELMEMDTRTTPPATASPRRKVRPTDKKRD